MWRLDEVVWWVGDVVMVCTTKEDGGRGGGPGSRRALFGWAVGVEVSAGCDALDSPAAECSSLRLSITTGDSSPVSGVPVS